MAELTLTEAEKAALKGDPGATPDMSAYYTKAQTDAAIADVVLSTGIEHGLWLDSFPGLDWDTKLDAAFSASHQGTIRRPVLLDNRDDYSFTRKRVATSGDKLICPYGIGTQARSAESTSCNVKFRGGGAWWEMPATGKVFDFELAGFSVTATATSDTNKTVLISQGSGSAELWTSNVYDISPMNFYGVLGAKEKKLLNTACSFFSGTNNIQNARGMQIHVGGSDSTFFSGKTLIDAGDGKYFGDDYLIWYDSQQKSHHHLSYITAENLRGIKNTGKVTDGAMYYHGMELEGRNAEEPSRLPLHIVSGDVFVSQASLNFANGPIIVQDGGRLFVSQVKFEKATSQSTLAPVFVQNGGYAELAQVAGNWDGPVHYKGANVVASGLAKRIIY